jgi:hypothetical protein
VIDPGCTTLIVIVIAAFLAWANSTPKGRIR